MLIIEQINNQNRSALGRERGCVALLLALLSASGGVNNLMTAINTAYDEEDNRSFVKKRLIALALTFGAIVFMVIMLALVAVVPACWTAFGDSPVLRLLLQAPAGWCSPCSSPPRWPCSTGSLPTGTRRRCAGCRSAPARRPCSGSRLGRLLDLRVHFGNYAKTYGVFAGIVVLLFWLWITSYAILLGAEINAEAEQQTVADTTNGPAEPLGQRNAVKADSLPGDESPR